MDANAPAVQGFLKNRGVHVHPCMIIPARDLPATAAFLPFRSCLATRAAAQFSKLQF